MRLAIYSEKRSFVEMYQSQNNDDAEVALNHMADWTDEEYKKILGYKDHQQKRQLRGIHRAKRGRKYRYGNRKHGI